VRDSIMATARPKRRDNLPALSRSVADVTRRTTARGIDFGRAALERR